METPFPCHLPLFLPLFLSVLCFFFFSLLSSLTLPPPCLHSLWKELLLLCFSVSLTRFSSPVLTGDPFRYRATPTHQGPPHRPLAVGLSFFFLSQALSTATEQMFLALRTSAVTSSARACGLTVFSSALSIRRCCESTSSSSSSGDNTGKPSASEQKAREEENLFSTPKDAMYASKIAHLLREQIFKPDFQTTKSDLSEKEEKLLRMWREMGNNPELMKEHGQANPFSETGAMETQTTSWEGSGAMAAAAEAVRMAEAAQQHKAKAAETAAPGEAKKSSFEDEAPVNVAEAYGQSFRDIRPIDPNEKVEDKRRRLIYQSRYRGMVEMDLILGHFARCRLESLDAELLDEYDTLLKQLDNDLFRWVIMDLERPPEIEKMKCFHELRQFVEKERTELLGSL